MAEVVQQCICEDTGIPTATNAPQPYELFCRNVALIMLHDRQFFFLPQEKLFLLLASNLTK